jgi:hypothetical protein
LRMNDNGWAQQMENIRCHVEAGAGEASHGG